MYPEYRLVSFGFVRTQWGLLRVLRPRSGVLQLEVLLQTRQRYGPPVGDLLNMVTVLVDHIAVRTTVLHVAQREWVWLHLLERIQECQIPTDFSCGLQVFSERVCLRLGSCLYLVW